MAYPSQWGGVCLDWYGVLPSGGASVLASILIDENGVVSCVTSDPSAQEKPVVMRGFFQCDGLPAGIKDHLNGLFSRNDGLIFEGDEGDALP